MQFTASQTSGSFSDNNFVSSSLSGNKDGDTLVVFDLGTEAEAYDKNVSPTYTKMIWVIIRLAIAEITQIFTKYLIIQLVLLVLDVGLIIGSNNNIQNLLQ